MASYNHTIVRNVSGVRKFFSFLGANGLELASGADYAHPGDLFDRWKDDTIQFNALRYALANGLLEIIKTPDVYMHDTSTDIVRRLRVTGGSVTAVDPDYGSYSGSQSTV